MYLYITYANYKQIRVLAIICISVGYIIWGFINLYHDFKIKNKISWNQISEYLFLGFIALAMFSFLIYHD